MRSGPKDPRWIARDLGANWGGARVPELLREQVQTAQLRHDVASVVIRDDDSLTAAEALFMHLCRLPSATLDQAARLVHYRRPT